jgi:sulfatase modifying factor 1
MNEIILKFEGINYNFPLVLVEGTGNGHYLFGLENDQLRIRIKNFFISRYPVTELLWKHVMGANPAHSPHDNKPVENVSYNDIVSEQGFLQMINRKGFNVEPNKYLEPLQPIQFRLPTETEWEYAARGGVYWGDYFIYAGSDNIDEVGWYKRNSQDQRRPVGLKKPNQLGIYDMSGNLWEWCADYFQRDTQKIPLDGTPCNEKSPDHVLRGGCYHNGGIHCTVMKRYEINAEYKDGCIGFRLALSL